MKTLIFSTKFLLMSFLAIQLSLCSNDDDNDGGEEESFQPIEITFTEDFITDCNQTKTLNGVELSFKNVSDNENSCSQEVGTCRWNDNYYPTGFSTGTGSTAPALSLFGGVFEIDLSNISDASTATITIDDNCGVGCTRANLYEGTTIVATIANTVRGRVLEDLSLNLSDESSLITLWSCEGAVVKILIE